MKRIRLCSFNVHEWVGPRGWDNLDGVTSCLLDMDADVVALQEVLYGDGDYDLEKARQLAESLGMHSVVAEADHSLANALLTRSSVIDEGEVSLAADGDPRSAAVGSVEVGGALVSFFATHLNHLRESTRLKQLRKLIRAVERRGGPAVIVGDFNSLRMADYEQDDAERIEASRMRARVEEARGEVMDAIDAAGWRDLFRLYDAGNDLAEYARNIGSPIPRSMSVTTPYGTRVDYAFGNRAFVEAYEVSAAEVDPCGASDHQPIVIDFIPRRPRARSPRRSTAGSRGRGGVVAGGDDEGPAALYHGTCAASAESLLRSGWSPRKGPRGPNGGDPAYLYVSTGAPDALWFAEQLGCDVVLRVTAPPSHLGIDPEDSVGATVAAELEHARKHRLPAKLTVRRPLGPEAFERVPEPWSEPRRDNPGGAGGGMLRLPDRVVSSMKMGLRMREAGLHGRGLVDETVSEAREAVRDGAVTVEKAVRMAGWMARHGAVEAEVAARRRQERLYGAFAAGRGERPPGRAPALTAWLLWGGPEAGRWASRAASSARSSVARQRERLATALR